MKLPQLLIGSIILILTSIPAAGNELIFIGSAQKALLNSVVRRSCQNETTGALTEADCMSAAQTFISDSSIPESATDFSRFKAGLIGASCGSFGPTNFFAWIEWGQYQSRCFEKAISILNEPVFTNIMRQCRANYNDSLSQSKSLAQCYDFEMKELSEQNGKAS